MKVPMHERVRAYVDANGLSRKLIAANMHISESRLSLILNGKRRMTVDDYENICKAIAIDPAKFYYSEQPAATA